MQHSLLFIFHPLETISCYLQPILSKFVFEHYFIHFDSSHSQVDQRSMLRVTSTLARKGASTGSQNRLFVQSFKNLGLKKHQL